MKELPSWPDDRMEQLSEKLLEKHEVGTVVIACIDFRFRKGLPGAIFVAFGIDDYDEIKLAGGAKNVASPDAEGRKKAVFDDLALALEGHRAKEIILLNHQNCGKYAAAGHAFGDADAERAFHEKELRVAGDIVFSRFPNAKIRLGYVWVDEHNAVHIDPVKAQRTA